MIWSLRSGHRAAALALRRRSLTWAAALRILLLLRTQDFHHFPKVDRNIAQLQSYAGSLRARTNKFRTLNNQIAATRLLAQQGFDASRCTHHALTCHACMHHACPPPCTYDWNWRPSMHPPIWGSCAEPVPCVHALYPQFRASRTSRPLSGVSNILRQPALRMLLTALEIHP